MDGQYYSAAKVKRAEQVQTLKTLEPGVNVGKNKTMHIDPSILFSRCAATSQRLGDDFKAYFEWEM